MKNDKQWKRTTTCGCRDWTTRMLKLNFYCHITLFNNTHAKVLFVERVSFLFYIFSRETPMARDLYQIQHVSPTEWKFNKRFRFHHFKVANCRHYLTFYCSFSVHFSAFSGKTWATAMTEFDTKMKFSRMKNSNPLQYVLTFTHQKIECRILLVLFQKII